MLNWRIPVKIEDAELGGIAAVYEDLRRLARVYLRTGDAHTLQPTALVHEAYLKLVDADPDRWQSREHFIHAAGRAMRQILVDHARRKLAAKRQNDLPFSEAGPEMQERMATLIHVEDALAHLEQLDPQLVQIVELRFFVGCSSQETADLLQLPERTVRHRWGIAKAFLAEKLKSTGNSSSVCE
jgi:RNA polymerase sigma factor (TIGR02999 family)